MAAVADQLRRFAADPGASVAGDGADDGADDDADADADQDELAGVPVGLPLSSRPRRARRLLGLVALLVVAALVVAGFVLLRPSPGGDPPTPSDGQAGATAPAARSEVTGTATPSATSVPTPVPETPTAAAPPPATAPAPVPTAVVKPSAAPTTAGGGAVAATVSSPPTAGQLAAAISRYYSLVPGRLDEAWPLMTADYQTRVAGGRQAYQRFWDGFTKVTATEVGGSPPSTATALITYTTKDGQVIRERTTFGLVNDGGVLKINSSTVTSRS